MSNKIQVYVVVELDDTNEFKKINAVFSEKEKVTAYMSNHTGLNLELHMSDLNPDPGAKPKYKPLIRDTPQIVPRRISNLSDSDDDDPFKDFATIFKQPHNPFL